MYKWSSTLAHTLGRNARLFLLFPNPEGEAVTKTGMIKAISGIAEALQLPLVSANGTAIYTGHSLRVSGAVHLAKAGIDIWRIQLHGRWGSNAVLRYVQLSPLSASLSIEASLGRDLKHMQAQILAAKAKLVSLAGEKEDPQESEMQELFEEALGFDAHSDSSVLGTPLVEDILSQRTKGWHRQPGEGELLVVNDRSDKVHSLRPPRHALPGMCLVAEWNRCLQASSRPTWCKCTLSARAVTSLVACTPGFLATKELCMRCFGKPPAEDVGSTGSSSSDSSR